MKYYKTHCLSHSFERVGEVNNCYVAYNVCFTFQNNHFATKVIKIKLSKSKKKLTLEKKTNRSQSVIFFTGYTGFFLKCVGCVCGVVFLYFITK